MKTKTMRTIGFAAISAALLVAGCDRGNQKPAEVAAPRPPPMPAAPAWSAEYAGKGFADVVTDATAKCIAFVDGVPGKVSGGETVVGWAWDPTAGAVVERILLVDPTGKIAGFGNGHVARPDVQQAKPEVAAADSGWIANVATPHDRLTAYGVLADGKGCKIGEVPASS